MKKLKNLTAAILLLTLLTGFAIQDDWFLFASKGFSMKFPFKPGSEQRVVNSAIGELNMSINMYDASGNKNDSNLVYGLIYTEYPDSLINSDKKEILDDLFRNSINGSVTSVSGKLLSEKIAEIDGFPGREVRIDFQDGMAIIRMRLYLVKNTMYILQTICETKKDNNKSIDRFMNSFKLIR